MFTTRKLIIGLVLLALALGTPLALTAVPTDALTKAEVRAKLKAARAKIDSANKRKEKISDQIAALDKRLTAIDDELVLLGGQITTVRTKLTVTQQKLDILQEQLRLKRLELRAAEEKLTYEQENLEMRVVAAYKTSDLTYVDVVLASTSFEDLVSRTSIVHNLIGGNNDLVGDLDEARAVVEREKKAIAEREGAVHTAVIDLQEQSDELVALRAAQAAQKAQSLAARKAKNGALASVRTDIAVLRRQEAQLLAESQQLTGVINGSSGGVVGTGDMVRPVNGPVTSPFGYRIHPILHYRKFHTGVDFGVGYGSPIRAADSGAVIYATWMGGYGNVIIVDHGRGISTLYAHQSSLAVSNGTRVTRGQTIGYVGSTGFSTGPHLHFEVRVNGNPVDPMGYIN
jgi:murein DD-endopeptidase MepM/ murein hydrolase activator NlpD